MLPAGRDVPEQLVRRGAFRCDVLGPAQLPGQRFVRVLPGEDPASRQMMQLDPPARPPHHPPGRERIQSQRQGRPSVVHAEHVPAGLVVHHHELARTAWLEPVIQAVDPAGDRDQVGPSRHRALHPDRLVCRVQPGHVGLHHAPRPGPVLG